MSGKAPEGLASTTNTDQPQTSATSARGAEVGTTRATLRDERLRDVLAFVVLSRSLKHTFSTHLALATSSGFGRRPKAERRGYAFGDPSAFTCAMPLKRNELNSRGATRA